MAQKKYVNVYGVRMHTQFLLVNFNKPGHTGALSVYGTVVLILKNRFRGCENLRVT